MHIFDRPRPASSVPPATSNHSSADVARIRSSIRPIYPYSIVPGGVRSADDVAQAMRRDPVVAEHYAKVRPEDLREERVEQPTLVHASYRIGDKVFWTKRTLGLHPGEKVLTDGKTTIRERCGNLLTVEPLAPALMDEPAAPEFDVVLSPWTPGAGYTLGSPPVFFDPPDPPDPGDPVVGPVPPLVPPSGPPSGRPLGLSSDPPSDPSIGTHTLDAPLPVPEPSTWILLSLGLIIVIARSLATRRTGQQ